MKTQEVIKKYLLSKQSVKKLEIVQFLIKRDHFFSTQPNTLMPSYSLYEERDYVTSLKSKIQDFYLVFKDSYNGALPIYKDKEKTITLF
ncbi:hypothetical protein [Enterococcus termitis]|uniref:Uncharacterized protein n=1 Tax=Enterococcus termitis TaxID=332950 RepID=A0A1E5GAS4_9ENTE|nr:hypothetical protein [Enterococcus termitis]OEG09767.1 hypothetical protein BCR25_09665 [Enterococcus termitis]OJG96895.1 hypothetical protein RV18_GL001733 [Enterococcus termitis]